MIGDIYRTQERILRSIRVVGLDQVFNARSRLAKSGEIFADFSEPAMPFAIELRLLLFAVAIYFVGLLQKLSDQTHELPSVDVKLHQSSLVVGHSLYLVGHLVLFGAHQFSLVYDTSV